MIGEILVEKGYVTQQQIEALDEHDYTMLLAYGDTLTDQSTISIGTVGNAAEIGDINYTAATVTLTGNQIASADQDTANSDTGTFEITGATVIDGAVTISTDVSTGTSGTNEDGTITFNGTGTIIGAGGTDNLTIASGKGVITFGYGVRPKHTIQKLFPTL